MATKGVFVRIEETFLEWLDGYITRNAKKMQKPTRSGAVEALIDRAMREADRKAGK